MELDLAAMDLESLGLWPSKKRSSEYCLNCGGADVDVLKLSEIKE